MNSERRDWVSECLVGREERARFLDFFRATLEKRSKRKARKANELDPTYLIERHNAIFGIDSTSVHAAVRYDLREGRPMGVKPVMEPIPEAVPEPAEEYPVYSVPVSGLSATAVPTSAAEGASVSEVRYDSDAPIDTQLYDDQKTSSDDFFSEIREKYAEPEVPEVSFTEIVEEQIDLDAAEFEDVKNDDIARYVESEMESHEYVQTQIDDPVFDVEGGVSAEPVIARQETFDVEFESTVTQEIEVEEIASPLPVYEPIVRIEAPAETQALPSAPAVISLGPATELAALPAADTVHAIPAAEQQLMIGAPEIAEDDTIAMIHEAAVVGEIIEAAVSDATETEVAVTEEEIVKKIQEAAFTGFYLEDILSEEPVSEDIMPEDVHEAAFFTEPETDVPTSYIPLTVEEPKAPAFIEIQEEVPVQTESVEAEIPVQPVAEIQDEVSVQTESIEIPVQPIIEVQEELPVQTESVDAEVPIQPIIEVQEEASSEVESAVAEEIQTEPVAEVFAEPVQTVKPSGISFRFGNGAASGTAGIRFVFGTASN